MRILMFAASLREDSVNKKLIRLIRRLVQELLIDVDLLDFAEFSAPLYNGDVEAKFGLPKEVQKFIQHLVNADGLIIASPEYNFSIPGTLKNLFDWVSRAKPMPLSSCPIMLNSASPALAGGSRGLLQTLITLEACRAYVFPRMFALADAYNAFDQKGNLINSTLQQQLTNDLSEFIHFVQKLASV